MGFTLALTRKDAAMATSSRATYHADRSELPMPGDSTGQGGLPPVYVFSPTHAAIATAKTKSSCVPSRHSARVSSAAVRIFALKFRSSSPGQRGRREEFSQLSKNLGVRGAQGKAWRTAN
jgi:hypothetical protein